MEKIRLKLYENVVIGNFLYTLGYSVGIKTKGREILSVVSLLQQTPDDQRLADTLLEFEGVVRLIEFKNKASSLKKEKSKNKRLQTILNKQKNFIPISREIHWYAETNPYEEKCINKIVPYLDAFENVDSIHTLESMVDEISDEVMIGEPKIPYSLSKQYLKLISCNQGNGSAGTGGLLVLLNKNKIRYLQYTDIFDLRLTAKQYVAKIKAQERSIMELELVKEIQLEKQHKKEKTLGQGMER